MIQKRIGDEDLKLLLLARALRSGISVRLKALGTSMLPSVWPGDLLTIHSAGFDDVAAGDIVLVVRDHCFFIHRLIEKRQSQGLLWCITKGDAIPHNDPPAPASELLGKVLRIERKHRGMVPARKVAPLSKIVALVLCYVHPLRNLAVGLHSMRSGASVVE